MHKYLMLTLSFIVSFSLHCMEDEQSLKAPDDAKILIFYKTDPRSLQVIKNYGIPNYRWNYQRTSTDQIKALNLKEPDENWDNHIYFSLSLNDTNKSNNTLGYRINPQKTYVYNKQYRDQNNVHEYEKSALKLHIYLKRKQMEEKMKWEVDQDQIVITDHRTAQPYYRSIDMSEKQKEFNQYIPEVRFYRREIPISNAIIFFDESN